MSLKKSLFTLTFVNLLLAVILSAVVFWSCTKLSAALDPSDVQIVVGADAITKTEFPEPTAGTAVAGNVLAVLQFCLPILFFIVALILTASLFYRWKLKEPLAILMDGANRMMENDLDFTIPSVSGDELGQLCVAFETMRQSLLNSNRELWRQTEERKRLNAAFSHDLRNPITVLKGSAKMAKQCADSGNTPQLMDNLERMEAYTGRIERYVETMSKVQRLEQVQPEKVTFDTAALSADLEKALGFSAADHGKQLYFHGLSAGGTVTLDKGMLFQVAENLTTNALRFAKENVSVELSIEGENLKLEIADDGDGFPAELLKSGIQPFRKGTEEAEHLGIIGILNIINTVYSNIHTRVNEIGMQRAIGMSAASLYKTFLWEGAYYAIFASVIGAVLGYVCCIFVGAAKTDALQLVAVPVIAIIEAAVVSVAACLLATAIPLHSIAKMNIVETIENIE